MNERILTRRLELVPASLDLIEAELRSPSELGALLNASVPSGWPPGDYDREAQEFFRERLAEEGLEAIGWYGWYGIEPSSGDRRGTLVACAGFIGPPCDGCVEIGYSVMSGFRGRGYASEMVDALVDRAFEKPGVREVVAHAQAKNLASVRVLLRNGFEVQGEPILGIAAFGRKRAQALRA